MNKISRKIKDENCPRHIARVGRTTCVSGKNSAATLRTGGRLSIGNTTPEKKNIGERNPVK
jgi:hypothetical protein